MCLGKVISDFQMQSLCISSTVGDSFGLNGEGPASVLRLRAQTGLSTSQLCHFGHPLCVTCVSDVRLLGENIPCKSLMLLYFHRLGEFCYFIIEIRISAVFIYITAVLSWKIICCSSQYLRMPKVFKLQKFSIIKFLCP